MAFSRRKSPPRTLDSSELPPTGRGWIEGVHLDTTEGVFSAYHDALRFHPTSGLPRTIAWSSVVWARVEHPSAAAATDGVSKSRPDIQEEHPWVFELAGDYAIISGWLQASDEFFSVATTIDQRSWRLVELMREAGVKP
jgi:hypothetical protein